MNKENNTQSVLKLSEDCVKRLHNDKNQKNSLETPPNDCDMLKELRCVDDEHSVSRGLTKEDFDILFDKVQSKIKINYELPCAQEQLINCLKKNPNCIIKCRNLANQFIDCIDRERIIKIKQKIEDELREHRQSEKDEFKKLVDECNEGANKERKTCL